MQYTCICIRTAYVNFIVFHIYTFYIFIKSFFTFSLISPGSFFAANWGKCAATQPINCDDVLACPIGEQLVLEDKAAVVM